LPVCCQIFFDSKKMLFGTYRLQKEEAKRLASRAVEIGYVGIDTASLYRNEQLFDTKTISTKIHWSAIKKGPKTVWKAIEKSLKKLGTIDTLFLHRFTNLEDTHAAWKVLAEAKSKGICRRIGVCNFNLMQLQSLPPPLPDVHQLECSPFWPQKDVMVWCQLHQIQLQTHTLLGGKNAPHLVYLTLEELYGWALNRNLQIIVGSIKEEHLIENIECWKKWSFQPREAREKLERDIEQKIFQAGEVYHYTSGYTQ
jgi:diketogulonate reductase-like aldo/keto reductase